MLLGEQVYEFRFPSLINFIQVFGCWENDSNKKRAGGPASIGKVSVCAVYEVLHVSWAASSKKLDGF